MIRSALATALALMSLAAPAHAQCPDASAPTATALDAALARPPAPAPQAMPRLHTEGTLPHQGIYDQSAAARRDFGYMRDLALTWRVLHRQAALDRLAAYFDAWMAVYRPSFNPIDETGLDDLIDAYRIAQPDLPTDSAERVQGFLRDMAEGYLRQMADNAHRTRGSWTNNWQSHRVKLATMSAAALGDEALWRQARQAFVRQLEANIGADGEVIDFRERDALHYVTYDLEPLLRAILSARAQGEDWLDMKGRDGQSVRAALDWLLPYAQGSKTHEEFARTTVKFDITRRDAGIAGFGGQWNPQKAAGLLWAASVLDARYLPTAKALAATPPRWVWAVDTCTLGAAAR
ncbi:MAG: alginate lyase family protein [Rhodocyclaceae bacterium]